MDSMCPSEGRCASSVTSIDVMADSDFNTESEHDHDQDLLEDSSNSHSHCLSHTTNKNRNARVIDGALYTNNRGQIPSSQCGGEGKSALITGSTSSASEIESASSGFYSSSESGSLRGTRHLSSKSGSDCDESIHNNENESEDQDQGHQEGLEAEDDHTILCGVSTSSSSTNSSNVSSATTPPTSNEESTSSSFNEHHNHSRERQPSLEEDMKVDAGQIKMSKEKEESKKGLKSSKDDIEVGVSSATKTNFTMKRFSEQMGHKLRSQSVSCISSLSKGIKIVEGKRELNTRVKPKGSSLLKETVSSTSRRINSNSSSQLVGKKETIGWGSSATISINSLSPALRVRPALSGSTRSLASLPPPRKTQGVALLPITSPVVGAGLTKTKINKWDNVMKKINEGKSVKINVKDVKPKVFDKLGPRGGVTSGGGSGVGSKSSESDHATAKSKAKAFQEGDNKEKEKAAKKRLQRTGSTSSDYSDHQVQLQSAVQRIPVVPSKYSKQCKYEKHIIIFPIFSPHVYAIIAIGLYKTQYIA